MVSLIKQIITTWNAEKNERLKMQQAYFTIVIILAVVSGLVTLINVSIGRSIVMIAAIFAFVYLVNAVSWVIFEMVIAKKLETIVKPTTKKR